MRSLRVKLAWSHVIPTILLLPILSLYLLFTLEDFHIQALQRQLAYQAQLMRWDLEHEAEPVTGPKEAQAFVESLAPSTDSHVLLLDRNGALLASTRPEDAKSIGQVFDHPSVAQALRGETVRGLAPGPAEVAYVAVPWKVSDQAQGVLRLSYEVEDVRAQFDQLQLLIVGGSAITIVVALGLALGLAMTITLPLRQLSDRAREIAAGHHAARVDVSSRDEVGLLALSFNQMAARLEEMEQARERQLAAIAHELARPLTGMRATLEALRDGADEDPAMRATLLAGTEEELTRLERLVATLQGLQKRALRPIQLARTEIAIDRAIRASVANFEPAAVRAGIALAVEISGDLPRIQADEDRIIQVLTNLLDNALKFTPRGGRILVRAEAEGDGLQVAVIDSGVGIAAGELPNLFQQFYRGDESRPPETRGMGLGLSICSEIIRAHQGKIWAESGPDKGTRFKFWLPRK